MSENICEFCDERPASSVFMGAFACTKCRRDIVGWPPEEVKEPPVEKTQEFWDEKHRQVVRIKIEEERERQQEKWGRQDHDDPTWSLILGEEYGELQQAILEDRFEDVERELVQVVAVGQQWLEALRRRRRARAKDEARLARESSEAR